MGSITFINFIFFKLSYIIKMIVLGGELAVPCNSQSAIVRLNSRTETFDGKVCVVISGYEGWVLCGKVL